MSSKITIYIPVYNGADYIECALNSILKQTYIDFSILISDNCSMDDTVNIIKKYLYDERITLIRQPFNLGMINQGNFLLNKISTEYCMGLCHDDFLCDDNALKIAFEILEKNKNISAVYSNMMFVDSHGKSIAENKYKYNGLISGDVVAKKSIISCRNLYSIPLLIRTSSIQGFRYTEGFYHTSDVDFSIYISKWKQIYYLPDPLVALRFHGNNNTARDYSKFLEEFKRLAVKYKISLSQSELMQMNINNAITIFKKHLFYFYLDKIRK